MGYFPPLEKSGSSCASLRHAAIPISSPDPLSFFKAAASHPIHHPARICQHSHKKKAKDSPDSGPEESLTGSFQYAPFEYKPKRHSQTFF